MVGQRVYRVGDVEGVVEGEFEGDSGRRQVWVEGGGLPVEAQGAEAQVGGLPEQIEQLGRVQAEVAIVQAVQAVVVVEGGVVQRQAVQLLFQALPLGLGMVEGLANVLARVAGAQVGDGQTAGLTADMVAGRRHEVGGVGGGRVLKRAAQANLEALDELVELAHHPSEGRRVGGRRLRVAGCGVSLQGGHWGRPQPGRRRRRREGERRSGDCWRERRGQGGWEGGCSARVVERRRGSARRRGRGRGRAAAVQAGDGQQQQDAASSRLLLQGTEERH